MKLSPAEEVIREMLLRRLLVLDLLVMLLGLDLTAQTPKTIGIVRSVSGPVVLTPATGAATKKAIHLTSSSVSRPLYDGDTVQADPQGEVTVAISGRTRTIALKANQPVQLHADHPATETEQRLDFAIKNFGAAGASRQNTGLLWWPADGASIRAHGFEVRWNPSPAVENYTLTLRKENGEAVWTSEPMASELPGLPPEQETALEQLFLQQQNDTASQSYTLTLASKSQGETRASFSLLSKAEEARIAAELQEWDKTQSDPLLRALGRAATLKSANLTCELAEEYQAALRLAPDSIALLHAALGATRATGNVVRSRELALQLRSEMVVPRPSQ